MALKLAFALVLVMLASCTQPAAQTPALIIDHCDLTEFRQECETDFGGDNDNPDLRKACMERATQQALRLPGGVTADCRNPGAEPRLW